MTFGLTAILKFASTERQKQLIWRCNALNAESILLLIWSIEMTAANILQNALGHMQDRAATYDKPDGERSMGATVDAFKAVTGVLMTEEQGWLFMALLKAVRSQQGAYRADSYEDGAAYFALAGESAAKERDDIEKLLRDFKSEPTVKDSLTVQVPASFGQQNMINPADVELYEEPAAAIDDESPRAQVVQQNGEMAAEVYAAVDAVDPWKGAPEWAKYKAQDADGEWYFYELEPRIDSGADQLYSEHKLINTAIPSPDWRTTLISR
jgi:hypothetical protein